MTREEAHRILSNGLVNAPSEHEWCMAFEMAIKALEQEPCDVPDINVGDMISRQAVDELSKELVHTTRDKADFLCNFWEGLQKLPSVKPQEPIDYKAQYEGFSKKAEIVISQLRADRDRLLEVLDKYNAESEPRKGENECI